MLLDLKVKTAIEKKRSGYKIYQAEGEPEIVEAETAAEAVQKTKIKTPTKIEKVGIIKKSLFSESELEQISWEDLQEKSTAEENVIVDDSQKYSKTEENTETMKNEEKNLEKKPNEGGGEKAGEDSNVNMSV